MADRVREVWEKANPALAAEVRLRETAEARVAELEAELEEERRRHKIAAEANAEQWAEVEKLREERDEAVALHGEDIAIIFKRSRRSADALRVKLAEVEKERDEWKEDAILTHSEYIDLPSRASIERARELVEELITPPVTRSPWPAGAQEDLQTIARLLSGKAE